MPDTTLYPQKSYKFASQFSLGAKLPGGPTNNTLHIHYYWDVHFPKVLNPLIHVLHVESKMMNPSTGLS